jgi:transglutaminase-like putative cysteine protease
MMAGAAEARDGTPLAAYLRHSAVIDWHHPAIRARAEQLAAGCDSPAAVAQACIHWVRDGVRHSAAHPLDPLTCRASEVLKHRTGFCFAKSHLLAALLRARGIPAGFGYQRLSLDDRGAPFVLHGLNAVHLPELDWYRIDARGNGGAVDAQFTPPLERLDYGLRIPGEADVPGIFAEPGREVVAALQAGGTAGELLERLPAGPLASR